MVITQYSISDFWIVVLGILLVWDLVWRGFALWQAGRNDEPVWFILLLVVNSAGILPIIYLLLRRSFARPSGSIINPPYIRRSS